MTLPEVELVLADSKDMTPNGTESVGDLELLQYAARWNSMTPLERLRNYQR